MNGLVKHMVVIAALGLPMLVATGASADSVNTMHGGCVSQVVPFTDKLVIADVSVTTSPADTPVWADVHCYVTVNGTPRPGFGFHYVGTGVQDGESLLDWTPVSGTIQFCETVDFDDGSGPSSPKCGPLSLVTVNTCLPCAISATDQPDARE
jgi:hypothetical protein